MLGHQIEYGAFNKAIQITASSVGIFTFEIIGPDDEKTCNWCAEMLGRVYRRGQFMPQLPKHPWCRHWFDIVFKEGPVERKEKPTKFSIFG
jgi:hypothetical protein